MFGRTLFGGSRFLFWALAPFLILFAIVMALLVPDWGARGGLLAGAVIAAALLLLLQLYDGVRFHWAGRVLAGAVFLAYAGYLVDELVTKGLPTSLVPKRGETSALHALAGLLVIGLPAGRYALSGRWRLFGGRDDDLDVMEFQRAVCRQYAAPFTPCDPSMKVAISKTALRGDVPLNGLRRRPESGTSGWHIWAGEELNAAPDFFTSLHVRQLSDRCPAILPYLALPPGWRVRVASGSEAVWFDESLL